MKLIAARLTESGAKIYIHPDSFVSLEDFPSGTGAELTYSQRASDKMPICVDVDWVSFDSDVVMLGYSQDGPVQK